MTRRRARAAAAVLAWVDRQASRLRAAAQGKPQPAATPARTPGRARADRAQSAATADPTYTLYAAGDSVEGFNSVYLTTYMTNKDSAADHPTAYAWYDELIVSTEPIAPPVD
jgi:hypothetical protein